MDIHIQWCCLISFVFLLYLPRIQSTLKDVAQNTTCGLFIGSNVSFHDPLYQSTIYRVNQFLGIPFAKPPTGALRFQKPQPIKCQRGHPVIHAKEMPKACVQYAETNFPWALDHDRFTYMDEDCLYLNIWTPSTRITKLRPVLFWIHGGLFRMGSINQKIYDGRALAGVGNVIVVTTNYRLGSLGFWTSNQPTAPGNVGVWDVIEALKWVNKHIRSFGGDKHKVTIAGQGAGAIIAGLLLVAQIPAGLFKRQIMQSGSPLYTLADYPEDTALQSRLIASRLGCTNSSYKLEDHPDEIEACMRCFNAKVLMREEGNLRPGAFGSFLPRWGDELFPINPRDEILNKNFLQTELLIGNNMLDGGFMITISNPEIFGYYGQKKSSKITVQQAKVLIRKMFPSFGDVDGLFSVFENYTKLFEPRMVIGSRWQESIAVAYVNMVLIRKLFPDVLDINNLFPLLGNRSELYRSLILETIHDPRWQASRAAGDLTITCPSLYYAEQIAAGNNKVHYYVFYSTTPKTAFVTWADWMKMGHFDELPYVFGIPFLDPGAFVDKEDLALSREIIGLWTDFVTHGGFLIGTLMPEKGYYGMKTFRLSREPSNYSWWFPEFIECDFLRPYFGMKPSHLHVTDSDGLKSP